MKSFTILYFSGTGNTQFVAEELATALQKEGATANALPLVKVAADKNTLDLLTADVIGIAFPVHSFNPPWLVEKLIAALPQTTAKQCFIIKTAGSPWINGGTTSHLKTILRHRGWKMQYEALVPMPPNLISRPADSFIKLNALMVIKQCQAIAHDLITEDTRFLPAKRWIRFFTWLMRIEHLGCYFGGNAWKVSGKCIKCGKCVKDCPTHNIRMEGGKFTFGRKCVFCMRCSFYCPVQAYSHKHFGDKVFVKPPFDIRRILDNPRILPADLLDDSVKPMKDFRDFWWREGLIE